MLWTIDQFMDLYAVDSLITTKSILWLIEIFAIK